MNGLVVTAVLSLCLTCGSDVCQPGAAAFSPGEWPELVATRQMMFFIPFGVSDIGEPKPASFAVSVQLWVSEDRAMSWQLAGTVSATERGFLFRAEHDGHYCFIARLAGEAKPESRTVPELCVLVDTQPPSLRLQAWRGAAGQICSRWEVDEPFVEPGSFQILYRTGQQNSQQRSNWREIAVDRRLVNRQRRDPATINWCVEPGARFVEVRAQVVDLAGNKSVSHAHVDISRDGVSVADFSDNSQGRY